LDLAALKPGRSRSAALGRVELALDVAQVAQLAPQEAHPAAAEHAECHSASTVKPSAPHASPGDCNLPAASARIAMILALASAVTPLHPLIASPHLLTQV
jgi:hypothetical protein